MCCYVSLIISLLITQLHTVSVSHDIVEDGGRGGERGGGGGSGGEGGERGERVWKEGFLPRNDNDI